MRILQGSLEANTAKRGAPQTSLEPPAPPHRTELPRTDRQGLAARPGRRARPVNTVATGRMSHLNQT